MSKYRLFSYNSVNRVLETHQFDAVDDERAISIAEGWGKTRKMELWNGRRLVRCWGFQNCANPACA